MEYLSTTLLYTFFLSLSRVKGVFFINFAKNFLRITGYVLCAILLVVTIFLIICAAAFGSKDTVEVFGSNIYIVQADGFEKAPKGSAILVQKTTAFKLSEGKLVLYSTGSEVNDCALGYVKNIYVVDGQYYLTVSDGEFSSEVAETRLIGRADYSSAAIGAVIRFLRTPFGLFCVAVLPCIALILYDIIRTAASRLPDPEVEPQYKSFADDADLNKAINKRRAAVNKAEMDDSVLFTYGKKNAANKLTSKNNRPIIPLTDHSDDKRYSNSPKSVSKSRVNPAAIKPDLDKSAEKKPSTPENIAVSRYIKNTENSSVSGKTAEIPQIPAPDTSDAFFTQTVSSPISKGIPKSNNAPQIGKQIPKRPKVEEEETDITRSPKAAGKRSSQILASKRVEDLIDDDDDVRSKKRITNTMVDDIMSGIRRSDK